MSEFHHVSVLLEECIQGLAIKPDGIYVDGTLGGAGHSSRIAAELTTGRLIGIDRDNVALEAAAERLRPFEDRVTLVHANFCDMDQALQGLGIDKVDGILLDLGVSSPQLDDGQRGFSYMTDAPLDMRMNGEDTRDARQIVNTWSYEELKRILYDYGEERFAPRIAAAICRRREQAPIETTLELVDGQAELSGHPHRRQRRAGGGGNGDEKGRSAAESGWAAGGNYLPFSGRPHCKKRHGRGGEGLHLPAQLPGVRLRQEAPGADRDPQAHRFRGRRAGTESQSAQREAADL